MTNSDGNEVDIEEAILVKIIDGDLAESDKTILSYRLVDIQKTFIAIQIYFNDVGAIS